MDKKLDDLKEDKIRCRCNPSHFFPSETHNDALQYLEKVSTGGGGAVLLTGGAGTGKTTVCETFTANLPCHVKNVLIAGPEMIVAGFWQTVNKCMEIDQYGKVFNPSMDASEADRRLISKRAGTRMLIIDDAHRLPVPVLLQLDALCRRPASPDEELVIVLVGRPELVKRNLRDRSLCGLRQRIVHHCTLSPMNRTGTRQYIRHRLARAGFLGELDICDHAYHLIHIVSGGVPRLINRITAVLLTDKRDDGQKQITGRRIIKTLLKITGRLYNPLWNLVFVRQASLVMFATLLLAAAGMWMAAPNIIDSMIPMVSIEQTTAQALSHVYDSRGKSHAPSSEATPAAKHLQSGGFEAAPNNPPETSTIRLQASEDAPIIEPMEDLSTSNDNDASVEPDIGDASPGLDMSGVFDGMRLVKSAPKPSPAARPENFAPNQSAEGNVNEKKEASTSGSRGNTPPESIEKAETKFASFILASQDKSTGENNKPIRWPEKPKDPWNARTRAATKKNPPELVVSEIKSGIKAVSKSGFLDYLAQIEQQNNRRKTLLYAIKLWAPRTRASAMNKLEKIKNDLQYFKNGAVKCGLGIQSDMMTLDQLKGKNLPAILEVHHPGQMLPKYLVIKSSDDQSAVVSNGGIENEVMVSLSHLDQYWSGVCHTLIKETH